MDPPIINATVKPASVYASVVLVATNVTNVPVDSLARHHPVPSVVNVSIIGMAS